VVVIATRRKHRVVVLAVAAACIGLFSLQWWRAPRVAADPGAVHDLPAVRGKLYLGTTFEGLPLRRVAPFVYSDCDPGARKRTPMKCSWLRVSAGVVTGDDPHQVTRARRALRPVG
jgi:hypothetical protein